MPPVWLIGMMGSGKSTVGKMLSEHRGVGHVDIDTLVENESGLTISELFDTRGESSFREKESAAVSSITSRDDVIVSTGGGVVLDPSNVAHMRATGVVVLLNASVPSLQARVGGGTDRPLLRGSGDRLKSMWDERAPIYEAAAHYVVDADQDAVDVVGVVAGCARFTVSDVSEVLIGPVFPRRLLPASEHREQAIVVAHAGSLPIARAAMARLESEVDAIALIEVPDREEAKTLEAMATLFETLAELNVGRHDTIVGVGGGTVTDAAGFAAATWLRGVESVSIPTTMLGAVDAAIGGKTGINVRGKNLVGAFWHARQISISLGILEALSEDAIRQGAAEALKAGFIADPMIVSLYASHGLEAPIADVVRRAVGVKASVVSEDFREHGLRAVLNFGHTIGHGIETHLGIPHGHAVAIGMVAAAAVSAKRFGFDPERVNEPIVSLGLPTSAPHADGSAVRELIGRDKKRTSEGLRMVLLRDIGEPVVEVVTNEEIDLGLAAIGVV